MLDSNLDRVVIIMPHAPRIYPINRYLLLSDDDVSLVEKRLSCLILVCVNPP